MARKCYECGQENNENCLACNKNAIRQIEYEKLQRMTQEEKDNREKDIGR